ncbi:MAG TPA: ABC transporter substrate-binding protein [Hymenobacter sp.]|uniref:ABC transporter substrate-binding protein n=1 Tax=Hymenobacter sp. TaxID=1898978 RepID=UPI002D80BD3D|nr:ABC transporter substrate-binding protein [Hymenobacter sp.]HET9505598.1 ABC transporter substrate-binding protein [Hymenobacter sp.]
MKFFWFGLLLALGCSACSSADKHQTHSVVRIRWVRDPENLSPLVQPNQNAVDALGLLHCSLLQVDFSTGLYAPALAKALPHVQLVGDSLTELRYELRPEATWDTGRPVLATDVAFSLKLYQCPGLPNEKTRAQLSFIRDIRLDKANPRRFTLVCRGQAPNFVYQTGDFPILPEAALDTEHTLRACSLTRLVNLASLTPRDTALRALVTRYQHNDPSHHPERLPGCGAYRMAAWEIDRYITFVRKPHWWADAVRPTPFVLQARPRQLTYRIISNEAAATLALRRQELDVLPQLATRTFNRLRADDEAAQELSFYTVASYELLLAGFNTRQPMLRDSLTRQALSQLFDPAQLLQATQLGEGLRTVGLVHPSNRRYYNDSLALPTYAPAQAVALLQRAGWQRQPAGWVRPGGKQARQPLALRLRYRADEPLFATVALQFKSAADKLGIPVALLPTEPALLTTAMHEGDFDVYVRKISSTPFAFDFTMLLHSRTIPESNFPKFSSRTTDHLIEDIAATGAPAQRRKLLRRFQMVMQQQMPLVPLFFLPYRLAAARELKHLYPSVYKPGYYAAAATWDLASAATVVVP